MSKSMTVLDAAVGAFRGATLKQLARLVEMYAVESALDLTGVGTCTLDVIGDGEVECDESYVLGPTNGRLTPDFTLKVVEPARVSAKLSLYSVYEVPEVWFWTDGKLQIRSRADGYARASRSRFLPDLNPQLIGLCMRAESQTEAVEALRSALRA